MVTRIVNSLVYGVGEPKWPDQIPGYALLALWILLVGTILILGSLKDKGDRRDRRTDRKDDGK